MKISKKSCLYQYRIKLYLLVSVFCGQLFVNDLQADPLAHVVSSCAVQHANEIGQLFDPDHLSAQKIIHKILKLFAKKN
jgi:hypothetical protein